MDQTNQVADPVLKESTDSLLQGQLALMPKSAWIRLLVRLPYASRHSIPVTLFLSVWKVSTVRVRILPLAPLVDDQQEREVLPLRQQLPKPKFAATPFERSAVAL